MYLEFKIIILQYYIYKTVKTSNGQGCSWQKIKKITAIHCIRYLEARVVFVP